MAELTETVGLADKSAESATTEQSANERRRRLRTKISAPVRVRMNSGTSQQAEVCTTVDASRDGLLFTTAFAGYRQGMDLAITFPYSGTAGGVQHERTAVVARVFEMPEGRFGIGIHFHTGKHAEHAAHDPRTAKASRKAEAVARDIEKPMPLVLIVESEARARDTLRNVLQGERYAVEAVETGAQAVDFLRQRTPNLLLTEIEIADMSGYDLCLIVKSNDRLRDVPVVMTTRRGQPSDYSTAHALGAIVCIAKPYKQDRLLHIVRMLAPPHTSEPPVTPNGAQRANGHGAGAYHASGNGKPSAHSNGHARR
ncbi:MAG TPA: response regulator [Candidatus Acidoferrales bacterium]|nr:response regulator [Candidatus Acidoferrales bacterium]